MLLLSLTEVTVLVGATFVYFMVVCSTAPDAVPTATFSNATCCDLVLDDPQDLLPLLACGRSDAAGTLALVRLLQAVLSSSMLLTLVPHLLGCTSFLAEYLVLYKVYSAFGTFFSEFDCTGS